MFEPVGIPWYDREAYAACVAIMKDGNNLPDTFDDWLAKALEMEANFIKRGHIVVRAPIRPDQFPTWCAARSLNLDSKARTLYASWVAKHRNGK